MKVNSQRRYDPDFKLQAVDLVLTSGKPVTQVARELGVPHWTLRRRFLSEKRAKKLKLFHSMNTGRRT